MAVQDQVPTDSGFGRHSTGDDVLADVDLTGATAIVTGGYSGIGLETVRSLVDAGATVVVPVRSAQKASENLAGIAGIAGVAGDVRTVPLDLADLATVRRFADSMLEELDQLDLLVNNAGIMACPEARVGPGWESQFGINHMGHFALTTALLPLIETCEDCDIAAPTDHDSPMARYRGVDAHACDDESAERLWDLSEAMLAAA